MRLFCLLLRPYMICLCLLDLNVIDFTKAPNRAEETRSGFPGPPFTQRTFRTKAYKS